MLTGRTNAASYLRQLLLGLVSVLGLYLLLAFAFDLRASAWIPGNDAADRSAIRMLFAKEGVKSDQDEPEEEGMDTSDVAPTDVDKYIRVYRAMQKDRNLTVDQAVQKEGWSVDEFRAIEAKIERDDLIRDHVRQELKKSAEKPDTKANKAKHKI